MVDWLMRQSDQTPLDSRRHHLELVGGSVRNPLEPTVCHLAKHSVGFRWARRDLPRRDDDRLAIGQREERFGAPP